MSEGGEPSRKRNADKQISRDGGDDSGSDGEGQPKEFVAAAPEVLAARKIIVARRPPPNADGTLAQPTPFAAILKKAADSSAGTPFAGFSFGAGAGSVKPPVAAASPFAGGTTAAPVVSPAAFGFGFGAPAAAGGQAASTAAPVFSFGFGQSATPAAPAAPAAPAPLAFGDPKFSFSGAVNAFTAAAKQVLDEKNAAAAENNDDGDDEDVEKEVPIGDGSADAPALLPASASVPTGEEDEATAVQSQAKLFELLPSGEKADAPKAWKERGSGIAKLNTNAAAGTARLIMREDKVKRALLNAPVNAKALKIVTKAEAHFIFAGVDLEGKVTSYLLRFAAAGGKTGPEVNKAFIEAVEKHLK